MPARRKRNLDGFLDAKGRFHPLRSSSDYDPEELGYSMPKRKKRKPSTKKAKRKNPATTVPTKWITAKIRRKGNSIQALIPQR